MKELVCNYAIARFLPYRETGEFVNLGVVLTCPQTGYFDFLFEKRKHKRVTDFFPELEAEILKAGLRALILELERFRMPEDRTLHLFDEAVRAGMHRFQDLVRPKESLLNFGPIGTILAQDPAEKLTELFAAYIKRQFAQDREYQEVIMRAKLGEFLQRQHLAQYYKAQRVGDENYHVNLPFVYEREGRLVKGIKPLHLDKPEPTEIYRHGDSWIASVRRLRETGRLPDEMLFTVKQPNSGAKRVAAAQDICAELSKLDAVIAPFGEQSRILEFARV